MDVRRFLAEEVAADHADGLLSRREAMRRLAGLGLGTAAAAALLAATGRSGATAASRRRAGMPSTDPEAASRPPALDVTFAGPGGRRLLGAFAAASAPNGAVLVIHENRGLTDHIRSLATRLAGDGYSALAIDLLSEEGGTRRLGNDTAAMAALAAAPRARFVEDLRAGLTELGRRAPKQKLAAVGFCFGGGQVWSLVNAGERRLAAAVPFYGPAPENPDFSRSKAAVLAIYGSLDERVNATRARAVAALRRARLTYRVRVFEGAQHAFFNSTGPRYHPAAARQAYREVLDWLESHLG